MSGVISAAMKHMIAGGMSAEQILAAVEEIEWAMMYAHPDSVIAAERKAKDRERKRLSKENSTETPIIILDNNSEGGVGETKPEVSAETPKSHLEPVVGAELAAALIEHRKKLRAPLTAFAAKKLAKALQRCPNPRSAAEKMLERGWKGIDPEWLKNGKDPPAHVVRGPWQPFKPEPEIERPDEAARAAQVARLLKRAVKPT